MSSGNQTEQFSPSGSSSDPVLAVSFRVDGKLYAKDPGTSILDGKDLKEILDI